jgi:hypothetical protein
LKEATKGRDGAEINGVIFEAESHFGGADRDPCQPPPEVTNITNFFNYSFLVIGLMETIHKNTIGISRH